MAFKLFCAFNMLLQAIMFDSFVMISIMLFDDVDCFYLQFFLLFLLLEALTDFTGCWFDYTI
jgi:hypothetical protein